MVEELNPQSIIAKIEITAKGLIYSNSLPLFEGTPSKTEGEPIDSKVTARFLPCLRGGGPRSGGGVESISIIAEIEITAKELIYSNSLPLFEGTPSKTEGEFLDSKVTERFLPCFRGGGPRSGGGVRMHKAL